MGKLLDRLSPEDGFLLNRFFTGVQKDFSLEELEKIQSLRLKNAAMVDYYLSRESVEKIVYIVSRLTAKSKIVALKSWLPIAGHIYFDQFL